VEREKQLAASTNRLVHYTTAHVAHSILDKREIWMRNAQTMNDFSEINHGLACLQAATAAGLTNKLAALLDAIHPGTWAEVDRIFTGWRPSLQFNTFMTCASEHLGAENDEDRLGRLSMWRAYGGHNGVALILNPAFLGNPDMGNIHTSPVLYADAPKFCQEFERSLTELASITDLLANMPQQILVLNAFGMLRFSILCTKHPGFWEEREWRVIYTPQMGLSPYVNEEFETIGGVPQVVHKIQLANDLTKGIRGLDPVDLIEGVLIGPTQFRMTLAESFHKVMVKAGIENPGLRLRFSDLPLRR
jgi:hypothetical protein